MTAYLLVNTSSGNEAGQKLLTTSASLAKRLVAYAQEIDFNNLAEQLRLAQQYPLILIAGGDGTISAVLAQLTKYSGRIGIIPLGTGNDLARELKIKKWDGQGHTLRSYLELFQKAQPIKLTLWQAQCGGATWVFSNYLSLGYDAQIVADFAISRGARKSSVWLNRFHYAKIAIRYLCSKQKLSALTISADGQNLKLPAKLKSIIFSNIKSIMGLGRINKISNPSDQFLEVNFVHQLLNYLTMILPFLGGLIGRVTTASAQQFVISGLTTDLALQIDGEARKLEGTELKISKFGELELLQMP
ncbi:hypothetical protein JNK13_09340 [bacterium]|nr:hypothetical protein [bacterium]